MRFSVEPRDICRIYVEPRIYLKGYGFLSFSKNTDTHAFKVAKSMSNR